MAIKVEVFSSPGCGKCGHAKVVLRALADELGGDCVQWREVNILEELDHAVELGILSTPAIAIDGELIFTGLPSTKKLRAELESRLHASDGEAQT
jgi:predicted thioredoxin/glutaredoxin